MLSVVQYLFSNENWRSTFIETRIMQKRKAGATCPFNLVNALPFASYHSTSQIQNAYNGPFLCLEYNLVARYITTSMKNTKGISRTTMCTRADVTLMNYSFAAQ